MKKVFALFLAVCFCVLSGCTMSQTMNGGGSATATTTNNQPVDSNNNTTVPATTTGD